MNTRHTLKCRLCGGEAPFSFDRPLAHGFTGRYHECRRCGLLQSDHLDEPSAIERVYAAASADDDAGAAWRQLCVARHVTALVLAGAFRAIHRARSVENVRVLDYGSGSGFLSAYLNHRHGWNVVGYDPYARPAYRPSLCVTEWSAIERLAPFDLVVASEVLEHLPDPVRTLDRIGAVMRQDTGVLYVTTSLHSAESGGAHWAYLAPHTAQHCTFFSRSSLQYVARRIGASEVLQSGGEDEWLFARRHGVGWLDCVLLRRAAAKVTRAVRQGRLERIT